MSRLTIGHDSDNRLMTCGLSTVLLIKPQLVKGQIPNYHKRHEQGANGYNDPFGRNMAEGFPIVFRKCVFGEHKEPEEEGDQGDAKGRIVSEGFYKFQTHQGFQRPSRSASGAVETGCTADGALP